MYLNRSLFVGLLALGLAGCGQQDAGVDTGSAPPPAADNAPGAPAGAPVATGGLAVREAWSRGVPPNAPVAAGYVSVSNGSDADDRLLSVRMDAAERVEIHEMTHGGDGTMQMRELPDGLAIPAGQAVDLRPGGLHLMFFGPDTGQWEAGASIPATLVFEQAGEVDVAFEVYPPGEGPAESTPHGAAAEGHGGHEGHEEPDAEHHEHQ